MITRGMEIASQGMKALLDMNDSIANNLANVNTPGYKKTNLLFKNIYDSKIEQATNPSDTKNTEYRHIGNISMGAQTDRSVIAFTQGILDKTDAPLDVAIEGDGFFKVKDTNGNISYTRDGQFTINNKNLLVTLDGDEVLDNKGKNITIDLTQAKATQQEIVIKEDGGIVINNPKSPQALQTIGIFDFGDRSNMTSLGNSKFVPTNKDMNPELKSQKFSLQQGSRELSNSNVVNEMINTINVSRSYETLSKFVKSDSELLSKAIMLGRVNNT